MSILITSIFNSESCRLFVSLSFSPISVIFSYSSIYDKFLYLFILANSFVFIYYIELFITYDTYPGLNKIALCRKCLVESSKAVLHIALAICSRSLLCVGCECPLLWLNFSSYWHICTMVDTLVHCLWGLDMTTVNELLCGISPHRMRVPLAGLWCHPSLSFECHFLRCFCGALLWSRTDHWVCYF